MLGAIVGDIVGSIYEFENIKTTSFPLFQKSCFFTDDTVLTVACAEAIMHGLDYAEVMRKYFRRYPVAGYGGKFIGWAKSDDPKPYYSFGNGAAMRISPVAWAFTTLEEVLYKAKQFTEVTHDHPEGIKGGQATAAAVFMARTGCSKPEIRSYLELSFGYDLSKTCKQIRPTYRFDASCQGTVPQAVGAFLESTDFESAIRLAISLGGDSDTLACITGSIAEAFYGSVPRSIATVTLKYLDEQLLEIIRGFATKFDLPGYFEDQ